ncbi:MAG: carboxypeptidase-like regulatory domain-containing protein [Chitinophagales bacterium]
MKSFLFTLKTLPLVAIACMSLSAAVLMQQDNLKLPIADKFDKWNEQHPEERIYLQFDKSLYQPGETVWFGAFVRQGSGLTPDTFSDILHIEVLNPKGAVERHMKYILQNGRANGDFTFTNEMVGGIYKFRAYTVYSLNDSTIKMFEKEVTLQKAVLANLLMKLNFKEKGYNPGQTAEAKLEIKTPVGQPLSMQQFTYEILTEGNKTYEAKSTTDALGTATITYTIPGNLATADLLLNVHLTYNNNTESVSRTVPVNLQNVQVEFYPEGGYMVNDLSGRVAFRAVDDFGKPVNIEGAVYNDLQQPVSLIQCVHHGMGSFQLTPQKGRSYYARLNSYGEKKFPLPEAQASGISIEVKKADKENLAVKIASTTAAPLIVITQMRGKIYDYQNLDGVSANTAYIPLKNLPNGVAQITVFDKNSRPLAERLVFVNKDKQLKLQINTNKEKYQPEDKVKITVKARDLNNKPVSGDVCLAVVDDKVLTLANDKSGTILSRLLLEADITGDVEEPNFYFDATEPKADAALDLLMMTRGWRRFVWPKVLSGDSTVYARKAERKIIAGNVMNFKDGKPTKNSVVNVLGTDLSATTDKNGHFEIFGADLSEVQVLAVRKFNKELYYNVNEYDTAHKLDFAAGSSYSGSYGNYRSRSSYQDDNRTWATAGNYRAAHKPTKKAELVYKAGNGKFSGTIIDGTNEPLFAATIAETKNGAVTGIGAAADFDGNFALNSLSPGMHHFVISYVGYESQALDVEIKAGQDVNARIFMNEMAVELNEVVVTTSAYKKSVMSETVSMDVVSASNLSTENAISRVPGVVMDASSNLTAVSNSIQNKAGVEEDKNSNTQKLSEIEIVTYKVPLIDAQRTSSSNVVSMQEIQNMPTRNVTDIVATVSGVFQQDEGDGVNIHGGRDNATAYYIDGVKVTGQPTLPAGSIDHITVYTGGIPASYGDLTGGLVLIETKKHTPITYYTYPGTRVSVLNEGIMAKYNASREFPKIVNKNTKHGSAVYDDRTTIYWSGVVHLDDFGNANFDFLTNDEISNFRITAEGISDDGLIGHAEKTYATQDALTITAKFPSEAVNGDVLDIPVVISNTLPNATTAKLKFTLPKGWWPLAELPANVDLPANGSFTVPFKVKAGKDEGAAAFVIEANTDKHTQRLYRKLTLKKAGFMVYKTESGTAGTQDFTMQLPAVLDSTFKAQLIIYPSGMSSLVDAVKGMIQEPHGCFEQVSSSTYPNIVALNMLQKMKASDPKLQDWATKCIADGYTALSNYEVPGGGFDLYGKAPANIPMTAYGLMEFTQMKKVYPAVSDALIERTRTFLLAQKNGSSFNLGSKNNYYPGANRKYVANAYICWALSEAGVKDIQEVVQDLLKTISSGNDPYQLALLAGTCYNLGLTKEASTLNEKLAALQSASGEWSGTESTIVGSYGTYADVEASALCVISLLHEHDKYKNQLTKGCGYLLSKRSYGGRFGNTQATILSLRALTEYYGVNQNFFNPENPKFIINGSSVVMDSFSLQPNYATVIEGFNQLLNAGNNTMRFNYPASGDMASFNVSCSWQSYLPESNAACLLNMQTTLNKTIVPLGETVRMDVSLTNKASIKVATPMVVVNIPSGLSLQSWQLKELKEKQQFDYYETEGNQLRLYFYGFAANEQRKISLDLKTEVKGDYRAQASSAYLYYNDNERQYVEGTHITIQ